MARIEELRRQLSSVAEFLFIYIKEAHPEDEWQMESNVDRNVVYTQPQSDSERLQLAQTFVADMEVETETLVDDIRNTANACYAAWPERIYIVDRDGRIAFKGGMGPFNFDPEEIVRFFDKQAS